MALRSVMGVLCVCEHIYAELQRVVQVNVIFKFTMYSNARSRHRPMSGKWMRETSAMSSMRLYHCVTGSVV